MLEGKSQFLRHDASLHDMQLVVRKTQSVSERTKGLLGTESLSEDQGLWILPCNSVHSFGMKYPLDIIYLNANQQIRSIRKVMKPARISMDLFAKSVLELNAGMADKLGLQPGDTLNWKNHD